MELLIRLDGDYAAAVSLAALLWRCADRAAVRVSSRALAESVNLSHQAVQHALQRLAQRELIHATKRHRTTGAYSVNVPALRQLLVLPLPNRPFLPGITPLPGLAHLQFVADATEPPVTHPS